MTGRTMLRLISTMKWHLWMKTSVKQSVSQKLVTASPTLNQLKSTKCGKKAKYTWAKYMFKNVI